MHARACSFFSSAIASTLAVAFFCHEQDVVSGRGLSNGHRGGEVARRHPAALLYQVALHVRRGGGGATHGQQRQQHEVPAQLHQRRLTRAMQV